MVNIFVEKAKTVMDKFLSREKERAEEIKRNNGYYSNAVAVKMNEEISKKSESDYTSTINEINDIFKDVRKKIAISTFPNANDITEDVKLFNNAFPLSQQEIEVFIEKYAKNETMLRIIEKYIDDNYSDNATTLAVLKSKIPSGKAVLERYRQIFQSAINLIGSIHTNPTGSTKYAIENFAPDLSVIGDGQYLNDYNSTANKNVIDKFNDISLVREFANTFEQLQ